MVQISPSLTNAIKERLNLKEEDVLTEEHINKITHLKVSKNDIEYLDRLPNLISIDLESFPSITNEDLEQLANKLPNLKSLKIKEQSALIDIDFSIFHNLEDLCLIHNENLETITEVNKLKQFTFYDNKDFKDNKQIVDIILNNPNIEYLLDILYYIDLIKYIEQNPSTKLDLTAISWVDSIGLRKYVIHEYTNEEIDNLMSHISYIVSKYIHKTDGDIEKFGILYRYMINNVTFLNEDDPKGDKELIDRVNNIYKVYNFGKGGRLSYAKAFQMLLAYAGVKSSVVYSLGALDAIGYYNGQKIYSLLGTSDYALLRVTLDDKYYYTDISWDSMVNYYRYFDELRLFLVSKEELQIRHKFVGEGNIENTYSYHGDDSDDLIMFSIERIKETDDIFNDITRLDSKIAAEELNKALLANTEDNINKINLIDHNIRNYTDMKLNAIRNHLDYFSSHYFTKEELALSNSELLDLLKNRLDNKLLSKYVYEILEQVIRLRATS